MFPCPKCKTEYDVEGLPMPWVCPACGKAFIGLYNPPPPTTEAEVEVLVLLPHDRSRGSQIAKLRNFVDELRNMPLDEAIDFLGDVDHWSLGLFSPESARALSAKMSRLGLTIRIVAA